MTSLRGGGGSAATTRTSRFGRGGGGGTGIWPSAGRAMAPASNRVAAGGDLRGIVTPLDGHTAVSRENSKRRAAGQAAGAGAAANGPSWRLTDPQARPGGR